MNADPLSRREFLRRAAGAAGLALASCTTATGPVFGRWALPRGEAATSLAPEQIDTRWPVKRVVYLMLENRSFDHLFGRFPGANGTRIGVRDGREVPLIRAPQWLPGDLPHDPEAGLGAVNGGKMDGFARGPVGEYYAYSQLREADVPNYWAWAREYVLCDNVFASVLGPSHPNHLFSIAGQSGGAYDNPQDLHRLPGQHASAWGCDANEEAYVPTRDALGREGRHSTCFDFPTVGDQLSKERIGWASYAADSHQSGYVWNAYSSIGHIFETELWHRHVRPVDSLLADIGRAGLPAVTWITPRFELSDHPPWSTCFAHNWVTSVVNALMRSPMWKSLALFVTWDEWGGFYDHVVPPKVDQLGLGIRVPMLLVSPYARKGYVDHAVGEFSTPLRFISDNWGLRYLTDRIAGTHNFEHAFDFRQRPREPLVLDPVADCDGTVASEFYRDHQDWPKKLWNIPGWWNNH